MNERRDFLKKTILTGSSMVLPIPFSRAFLNKEFESHRPKPKDRNFTSEAVEKTIGEVKKNLKNKELAWLFENCFPNTLDTTVKHKIVDGKPDTFVITGDIEAMWLRDSTAQVWPYLPLANEDPKLKDLLAGVVNRQTKCILIDPYANAFNEGPTGSEWEKDLTEMKPELHERKWEIDSLCYAVRLAYGYWKTTNETSCFDENWQKAMKLILQTFKEQQRKEGNGPYKFQRITPVLTDTVAGRGYGNPIKPVGLICSIFRPSDDSTIYPFLIPSNLFAIVSLRQMAEIFEEVIGETEFADQCKSLAFEVEEAVQQYAISNHLTFGNIYAFETDGFGNQVFMDDSNIPSLLSLPYLGCFNSDDPIYQNTRKFVLSTSNPYFFRGKAAEGIGGPHVGMDYIWPMSITMRALTSNDDVEIKACVKSLIETHGGTGFMHEGFHKDDPKNFTRKWFAWSNTLFGELILKLYKEHPELLDL
ncbi:MAG: glycoside hydrolase family 125 protein [Flammeovirgaceae bacterium]|nr:glycoside hydrolase family 125 protein [Flammeovirgaceae bacterium]